LLITAVFKLIQFLGRRLGVVLIDLLKSGVSARAFVPPYIRTYIRPPDGPYVHKKFFPISIRFRVRVDLDQIYAPPYVTKSPFSRSLVSFAIFAWSSKLMVCSDSVRRGVQFV